MRRRTIEDWERGKMFGEHIISGYIDGHHVTAIFRWGSLDRFGLSWGQLGTDEIVIEGRKLRSHHADSHDL